MSDLPFDFDDLDELDYCRVLDLYAAWDDLHDLPAEDERFDGWLYSMI